MEFPHKAPKGMHYEVDQFKRNVHAIYICYDREFDYNNGKPVRCIWGFYNTKTKCYHAPINATKQGDKVNLEDTTPYTAMQLNLNPLERAFL